MQFSTFTLRVLALSMLLSACAHLPNDDEKNAFRAQQNELKKIENVMYNGKETGLYDQLKTCSMQLHDRVNPEEAFEWSEPMDKHPDQDYFADPDHDVSRLDFTLLVEKYKIYRQVSLARKDNFEHRLHYCQSDLKAAMRRENIRSRQEQALLDKLSDAEKAARQPAAAAPAVVVPVPDAAPNPVESAPAVINAAPTTAAANAAPVAAPATPAPTEKAAPAPAPVKSAGPAPSTDELSLDEEVPAKSVRRPPPHSAKPRKIEASDELLDE